ncbi:MAG: hypothetical protein M3Q73_00500 [bacterium]|nr:hypothetical protein [bacterium]
MEGKFQTSFIPKKNVAPQLPLGKPVRTTNFFSLIVTVVFVTVILISIGVFGYNMYLDRTHKAVQEDLNAQLDALKAQNSDIIKLTRMDLRLKSTKALLDQHVALTELFQFLGDHTLSTVRYTGVRYNVIDGKINVILSGEAKSFASLALQSDELLKEENKKYVKGFTFSNYNLDPGGNVVFLLTATLDQDSLLYKDTIATLEATEETTE